jgi:hypothetical protein
MECTSESLGAVLRVFCPCGLVRQALNYILRGVRIGADRVQITLFLRGAERVHVPMVSHFFIKSCKTLLPVDKKGPVRETIIYSILYLLFFIQCNPHLPTGLKKSGILSGPFNFHSQRFYYCLE